MKHKCTGPPCYLSKEKAIMMVIKALENDDVDIPALEWVLDSIFYGIHVIVD